MTLPAVSVTTLSKQALGNSTGRDRRSGIADVYEVARFAMPFGRCRNEYLLAWKARSNSPNRWDVIAVSADYDRAIKYVVYRILKEREREMDIRLFLLVLGPPGLADPA
jgi:hypothetical protein